MSTQAGHSGHHMAHLDLMPVNDQGVAASATHVAVRDGDWFDAGTWSDGRIPDDGAMVHIPDGVSVGYQGQSNAELFMVRVDGDLTMSATNGGTTKIVVDTIITSDNSTFTIDADAASDGNVDVIFTETASQVRGYADTRGGDGVLGRSSWDPDQLSLGLVASGEVDIKGQSVDASLQLTNGPGAGATSLTFDTNVADSGWAVGQTIVVGGTRYLGDDANGELITQDEVRTITSVRDVNGQMVVTLDSPLQHDHTGVTNPQTGEELTGYVGNLSRNVTFSSAAADPDGDGVPSRGVSVYDRPGAGEHYVTERGHIMFMHNDDVDVQNSAFVGLGRTDKSIKLDDFQTGGIHDFRLHVDSGVRGQFDPGVDVAAETADHLVANMRGRYALHIHEANHVEDHDDHGHSHGPCPVTGADVCECDSDGLSGGVIGPCPETGGPICHCDDQDGDGIADHLDEDFVDAAYLHGNAVWGTPGWGIVQHSSDAALTGNFVYDAAGAAFVAEIGDERGVWNDNLAMGTYGVRELAPNQDAEAFNEDDGASGVGFYMKSRAIDLEDNAAVSSGRAGFFWHSNGGFVQAVDVPDDGTLTDVAHGLDEINIEDVPILIFRGNEVIGAREGVRVTTDPLDAMRKFNDVWSHYEDLILWEVDESGVSITYSSKYVFTNILILGTENKVSELAQASSSGFFFKVSSADMTIVDSHVENFDNAVTNWSQVGDRQEYRRGFWDPKDPHETGLGAEHYDGLGRVEGIENPIYNLWNMNIVNISWDNIDSGWLRASNITDTYEDGTEYKARGVQVYKSHDDIPNETGVNIELLGDSRDGGLVALWREDIATNPNQAAMLATHIPLAYQENSEAFLSQIHFTSGVTVKRNSYLDYDKNINADIWSGTVLEFAKEDSFGRQVFLYDDFSPLNPSHTSRAVTTNERIVISKDMVDGVLAKDGYYHVAGVSDVKFVVVDVIFSDRLTGTPETKKVVMALDLAWEMPETTNHIGLLAVTHDTIIAPQYRVFENGVLKNGRDPIVIGEPPEGIGRYVVGIATTEGDDELSLGADSDRIEAAGGDDLVRGFAAADHLYGGDGADALFGGAGWDRVSGGNGNDLLDGHLDRDFLYGGSGEDQLQGGIGRDHLEGGDGNDVITAGTGNDEGYGGAGDDTIDGGNKRDSLWGGDGVDHLSGGVGFDTLFGGAGDDILSGNAGKDHLYGDDGADLMNGGALADSLFGGAGTDHLQGDAGADALYGGAENDLLEGQMGRDALYGGDGSDALIGGAGDDRLFGGEGADTLSGGAANDRLTGGGGADRFVFDGNSGQDVITDFEDGVDAIEFMIEAFGFEDLSVVQDGDDAVLTHAGGGVRLVSIDGNTLDEGDFSFSTPP